MITAIQEILRPPTGLYRIYWESGGSSLASIGYTRDGKAWFAATNWINGSVLMEDWITHITGIEKLA